LPELDDEDQPTGIQEKPRIKASAKSPSKNRAADDDDDLPHKRGRGGEDDDHDQPFKRKKKAKQKAGGSLMVIVLLLLGGGGLFLVCAGVGLGAFVWPGFMLSKPDGKKVAFADGKADAHEDDPGKMKEVKPPVVIPQNDIYNYMLADASVLFGSNMKGLRDKDQLEPLLNQLDAMAPPNNKTPKEFRDLFRNCDGMLLSLQLPPLAFQPQPFQPGGPQDLPKAKVVMGVLTTPQAAARFRSLPKLGAEEKLAGKYSIFRPGKFDRDWPPLVAFAGDRLLLFAELTDNEMIAILDQGARKQGGQNRLVPLARTVDSSHFWAAWLFDENVMRNLNAQAIGKEVPAFVEALQALQRAKGGTVSANSTNGNAWRIQVGVECANQPDAASVKSGGDAFLPLMFIGLQNLPQGSPKPPPTLMQDLKSINLETKETTATLTMQITPQTLSDLAKIGAAGKNIRPIPPMSYVVRNLQPGQNHERQFQFLQGTRVITTSVNQTQNPLTDVDLYVFRKNQAGAIALDTAIPQVNRNCRVEFVVPATDTYIVRLVNLGPGIANSCSVTIQEQ
jgi:hypothetical protein